MVYEGEGGCVCPAPPVAHIPAWGVMVVFVSHRVHRRSHDVDLSICKYMNDRNLTTYLIIFMLTKTARRPENQYTIREKGTEKGETERKKYIYYASHIYASNTETEPPLSPFTRGSGVKNEKKEEREWEKEGTEGVEK